MSPEDLNRILGRPLEQCGSAEIAHISRRAHRKAADLPPVVSQEQWELERARAMARELADDLRQTGKTNVRIWDAPSSGPWKHPAKKRDDRLLTTGQMLFLAAVVGGAMWAGLFKWLGVW